MSQYHVHSLTVENFKRITAARLELPATGGTIEVCGRNGHGKSSLLDSIFAAIGGKAASPDQPIRTGARRGSVEVDLGDIVVRREWDASGTRLAVTDAEHGGRISRPQELLDSLFDRLAFDPLEFTRKTPSDQARILREIAGLDFSDLDQRRAELAEERRDVDRAVKAAEAKLFDLPEVPPTDPVSLETLNAQLRAAGEKNAETARARRVVAEADAAIARAERQLQDKRAEGDRLNDRIREAREEIARLEEKIRRWSNDLSAAMGEAEALAERVESLRADRDQLEAAVPAEVDTAPILRAIENASAINDRARKYRERKATAEEVDANRRHAQKVKERIEDVDTERQQRLATATFPVPGLGLDGDTVTFGGVPLDQASSAEQIRVSLGIGAAMNPKLRLLVVKDGSLLDDRSLALVAEWAAEHDYQVIVERVATSVSGQTGIVIEEGAVVEAVAVRSH